MLIKILAILLMLIFYISYFYKQYSQKKRGITTNQMGKGKQGFVKIIEITLSITTAVIPFIELASIIQYKGTIPTALRIIGIIVTTIGVTIFILSITQMQDNWRAGVSKNEKTSLVTTGIYSISRNPAFLGFDMMYIGILVAFFNYYLFIATIIAALMFHLQIVNVEECFLIENFKDEYIEYKHKVCRYIGKNK